jgi:thiamine pyrophosphokinase
MSSHHIVRENQEPALVVEDFGIVDFDLVGQLLEWSPTLITGLHGFFQAVDLGIKVDYVVLISEELPFGDQILERLPEGTKIFNGSTSFWDGVTQLLKNLPNPNAYIIPRIADPLFFLDWLDEINPVIFSRTMRYSYIESGYSKWKPKGSLLSLLHIPSDLKLGGVVRTNIAGQFICSEDGIIRFQFQQQHFMIIGESFL